MAIWFECYNCSYEWKADKIPKECPYCHKKKIETAEADPMPSNFSRAVLGTRKDGTFDLIKIARYFEEKCFAIVENRK